MTRERLSTLSREELVERVLDAQQQLEWMKKQLFGARSERRVIDVPAERLSRRVYNIQSFSATAFQYAEAIRGQLPGVEFEFSPDPETVKSQPPTAPGGREGSDRNGTARPRVDIPPKTAPPSQLESMAKPTHWLGSPESPLPKYCEPLPTATSAGEEQAVKVPPEVHGDGALFPALVVGVGKLGLEVLQQLRDSIQERVGAMAQLPNLRLLFLDTDPEALRTATRDGRSDLYARFSDIVAARAPVEPRDLLELVPAGAAVPLEEVEPVEAAC